MTFIWSSKNPLDGNTLEGAVGGCSLNIQSDCKEPVESSNPSFTLTTIFIFSPLGIAVPSIDVALKVYLVSAIFLATTLASPSSVPIYAKIEYLKLFSCWLWASLALSQDTVISLLNIPLGAPAIVNLLLPQ